MKYLIFIAFVSGIALSCSKQSDDLIKYLMILFVNAALIAGKKMIDNFLLR
jgi:hypothetical protein